MKGRVTAAGVGIAEAECAPLLATLTTDGLVTEANGQYRLAPGGKVALASRLTAERETIDVEAIETLYEKFPYNDELKELASAWQMRDGEPKDHSGPEHDAGVVAGLSNLHARFIPLVERFVTVAPRLAPHPARFGYALVLVEAGDHGYFLRPIIDSHHTVWFEFHEELAGRTREDEAKAGRAE